MTHPRHLRSGKRRSGPSLPELFRRAKRVPPSGTFARRDAVVGFFKAGGPYAGEEMVILIKEVGGKPVVATVSLAHINPRRDFEIALAVDLVNRNFLRNAELTTDDSGVVEVSMIAADRTPAALGCAMDDCVMVGLDGRRWVGMCLERPHSRRDPQALARLFCQLVRDPERQVLEFVSDEDEEQHPVFKQ